MEGVKAIEHYHLPEGKYKMTQSSNLLLLDIF